jgi:hypothetical protein
MHFGTLSTLLGWSLCGLGIKDSRLKIVLSTDWLGQDLER